MKPNQVRMINVPT